MVCEDTPRRQRKAWALPRNEERISLGAILHSTSVQDTSIVMSEASTPRKREAREEVQNRRRPPSVTWEIPMEDSCCNTQADPAGVGRFPEPGKRALRRSGQQRALNIEVKSARTHLEGNLARRNAQIATTQKPEEQGTSTKEKLRSIKQQARQSRDLELKQTSHHGGESQLRSKGSIAKDSLKKILSRTRARQKILKSRGEGFKQTIDVLKTTSPMFRRASEVDSSQAQCNPEELIVIEMQQAAFDRWEKAAMIAKQALEEVIEAEKVLCYAAEFEQLKESLDSRNEDWDVGVDKYLNLYKALQSEYPETVPIKPSRLQKHRRRPSDHRVESNSSSKPSPIVTSKDSTVNTSSTSSRPSGVSRLRLGSSIPSRCPTPRSSFQFDPRSIRDLGRRFAHAAECWFLRLISRFVDIDFQPSVYCREDCYFLMESLRKVQSWLLQAKGRTRIDRNEALLVKLRETIIQWSSKMIRLPPAKTIVA